MKRSVQKALIPFLVLASILTPSFGSASARLELPLLMGVMGDSISAGTLADFPIPNDTIHTESMDAARLKAQFLFENKWTYSWASGRWIRSHYERLRSYLRRSGDDRSLFVQNVSFPGDTTADMPGQARELLHIFQHGGYSAIKYITMLVGSNDVCSNKTPEGIPLPVMKENLLKAFHTLSEIRQSEPIRVLVVGIPRIPDLAAPDIRDSKTILGLSCQTVRQGILGECTSLLNWKTPEEYDQKMEIVENANRLIRSVVDEVNHDFPNIEAVYSDRLYNLNIPRNVLAIDCFHPNAAGQQALADQTWLDQPWFN